MRLTAAENSIAIASRLPAPRERALCASVPHGTSPSGRVFRWYLLGGFQIHAQLARLAEVDVLGHVVISGVVVHQHADDAWQRARHRDLAGAHQGHLGEAELPSRDG